MPTQGLMTMQQVKNINKTDKHIHSHKKGYLEVISRFTRFKEFNGEKNTATKTSNMFKIVPRIGMRPKHSYYESIIFDCTHLTCVCHTKPIQILSLINLTDCEINM
jgi:hypothetical protein